MCIVSRVPELCLCVSHVKPIKIRFINKLDIFYLAPCVHEWSYLCVEISSIYFYLLYCLSVMGNNNKQGLFRQFLRTSVLNRKRIRRCYILDERKDYFIVFGLHIPEQHQNNHILINSCSCCVTLIKKKGE